MSTLAVLCVNKPLEFHSHAHRQIRVAHKCTAHSWAVWSHMTATKSTFGRGRDRYHQVNSIMHTNVFTYGKNEASGYFNLHTHV